MIAYPLTPNPLRIGEKQAAVAYIGLTTDGNPKNGPRPRVRTADQFFERLSEDNGSYLRFEYDGTDWPLNTVRNSEDRFALAAGKKIPV